MNSTRAALRPTRSLRLARSAWPLRGAVASASLALLALSGCPGPQGAETAGATAAPESEDDKAFYVLGYFVMKRASAFQLDDREREMVLAGARDALAGGEAIVDVETYQQRLGELFQERQSRGAEGEQLASQAWVDEQAEKPGAVRTPSGLVYLEIEAGDGAQPAESNKVRVHYHGTLRDGTVFDSSIDRGAPSAFPLNRVIPCWTEALQRMRVGGKAEVICPASIAYGAQGAPPKIPPGAALHFDVELLEIVE